MNSTSIHTGLNAEKSMSKAFSLRAFFAHDTTKDWNIAAATNRLKLEKKRESFSLRAFFAHDTTLPAKASKKTEK